MDEASRAMSLEAERILGVTNEQLAHSRSTAMFMDDFLMFSETI